MTYEQALEFVRKNKEVLKLRTLAQKAGIAPSTFVRVITPTPNQYGGYYNIPEKYRENFIRTIEDILSND